MEHEGFYLLGIITRTHGVKGNVIMRLDVDDPNAYKKLKEVYLEKDGFLQSFKVTVSSLLTDHLNVHLDGVEDMDAAEQLIKTVVFLPVSALPALKGNKLYLHEAKGMMVIDATEGELGIIDKIFDLPEQPVASVNYHGKEMLFPLIAAFIESVDREKKVLHVRLPEGLTAIYR